MPRPRLAGEGEWRLGATGGERVSLPGRLVGSMGLRLCLGGELEERGVRLFWEGELLRFGDLEGLRLPTGDGLLEGDDPESLCF